MPNRRTRQRDSGYAIVIVMFFLALLVLSAAAAAPTVLSEIQREREADMVWKGEQYARGVKLFYMKTHRFPPSLEDLTSNKTGIRFMRQAYKDPMNNVDGSWRLIYVGPNGALIGSLKNRTIGVSGQPSAPTNTAGASSQSSFGSSSFGGSSLGAGAGTSAATTNAGNANQSGGTDSADSSGSSSEQPQSIAQPIGTMDANNVIGGNIIGVGSKIDKKSFLWYEKAKNYREFEFIWDPSKDARIGGATRGIGTPIGNGAPGVPVAPTSPFQNQNINGTQDPGANPPLQAPPSPN
jgi:hypothetical protein